MAKIKAKKVTKANVSKEEGGRNRRNPEKTREAILRVAGKLIASDGPEALSVSAVAQKAGVNRGTAYHHFQTREQLVDAAMEYVSQRLHDEIFGEQDPDNPDRPRDVIAKLAQFAMDNPEFGPTWMHRMIRDRESIGTDPFWSGMVASVQRFAESDYAQPGIDAEIHALTLINSMFTWPLWINAREKSPRQRRELAQRYTREALRLAANGVIKPGVFKTIDEYYRSAGLEPAKSKKKQGARAKAKSAKAV